MMTPPNISVVIPSFARPARLKACLSALAESRTGDATFEVVVIDDGSPEPLAPFARTFEGQLQLRVIRQENRGPASARNAGASAARGELLAFTDDDCLPEPGWLAALWAAYREAPGAMIGGQVRNALPDNPYSAASQDLVDYIYEYYDVAAGNAQFFTSNNLGCDRLRFLAIGGFDESFPLAAAEDREIGMRWRDEGGALIYAPDAVVGHAHALSFSKYWRQHSNYGRGARHLHRVRSDSGRARPGFERIAFYTGLLTYPMRKDGARGLPKSALMALSQVAMTAGFVRS